MPEVEELFDPYAVEETPDTGLTALAENFVTKPFKPDNSAKGERASAVEKIIKSPTEPVMVISVPQSNSARETLKEKTEAVGLGQYITDERAEPITLKVLRDMSPEQQEALRTIMADSNEQLVIRIPVALDEKPFPLVYQQKNTPKTETLVVDIIIDPSQQVEVGVGLPHEAKETTYFPRRWHEIYSSRVKGNDIKSSIEQQLSQLAAEVKIKDTDIATAIEMVNILAPKTKSEADILDQYKAIAFMPDQEEFDLAKALEVVKEHNQGGTYPLAEPIAEIMKKVVYCKDTTDPYAELTPVEWSMLASLNLFDPKKILARRSKSKSS